MAETVSSRLLAMYAWREGGGRRRLRSMPYPIEPDRSFRPKIPLLPVANDVMASYVPPGRRPGRGKSRAACRGNGLAQIVQTVSRPPLPPNTDHRVMRFSASLRSRGR